MTNLTNISEKVKTNSILNWQAIQRPREMSCVAALVSIVSAAVGMCMNWVLHLATISLQYSAVFTFNGECENCITSKISDLV